MKGEIVSHMTLSWEIQPSSSHMVLSLGVGLHFNILI